MHELSIAASIVELAEQEARKHGAARVQTVYIQVGALSGVVKDSLLFVWEMACDGTLAAGSRLDVEEVPVQIRCGKCLKETTLAETIDLRCPGCGGFQIEVQRGKELQVTALELEPT